MGFGPWGRWSKFFDNGEVRLALLSLLESAPKHGYQLIKDLEERSGGLYRASAGTVYPTLQQLEDEGLVTSQTGDGKRVYTLTDAGRSELGKQDERVKRIWRRANAWGEWAPACSTEAVMVAASGGRLMGAAIKAARGGADPNRVCDILDRTRREIESLMSAS
jgi:DNA-binding PadR family transcriptional regulator